MSDSTLPTNLNWLSHIQHELKTPVNAIIGYSEMILEGLEGKDNSFLQIKLDLQKINRCGKDISGQINYLFSQNKIHQHIEITKLHELFSQILILINEVVDYCDLLITNNKLVEFSIDLEKITLAAENFIGKVNDIFQLFTSEYNQLVSTENIEEKTFELNNLSKKMLSRNQMITDVSQTLKYLENNKYKKLKINQGNILIVDDNGMNRDLISRRLLNQGYLVDCAVDGKQALKMLENQNYDLILLDIVLPELNGYQVLKYIKANEAWRDIPVIMISAVDDIESVVRCIEMGAEDYLTKPFNSTLLKARIGACLEKKRFRDKELIYLEKLAQTNEQLTIANEKLLNELFIAQQIQEAMLPRLESIKDCFDSCELSASLESARVIGGDLYDFFLLSDNNRLCFLIGDVADKGIPAALFMAKTITLIRTLANDSDNPVSLLTKANQQLCRDNEQSLFVTLLCGILDLQTGIVEWASAGHDYPLVVNRITENVRFIRLETGMPLGIDEDAQFPLLKSQLEDEDILLLYTDGITEARNSQNQLFGEENLQQLLMQSQESSPGQLIIQVKNALVQFINKNQHQDDITMLCLKYRSSINN